MEPITSVTAEQLTRALGEAVIRIWSNLPQDVQNHLFQSSFGERLLALLGICCEPRFRRNRATETFLMDWN